MSLRSSARVAVTGTRVFIMLPPLQRAAAYDVAVSATLP